MGSVADPVGAHGRHGDENVVAARLEYLEQANAISVDPAAVRRFVERERAELPGLYIVGTTNSQHYMTITIDAGGNITGFDPQNGATYRSLQEVLARMKSERFDLAYQVTAPLPPEGGAR